MIANHKIMKLKYNFITKGLVPSEILFNHNNVVVIPFTKIQTNKLKTTILVHKKKLNSSSYLNYYLMI